MHHIAWYRFDPPVRPQSTGQQRTPTSWTRLKLKILDVSPCQYIVAGDGTDWNNISLFPWVWPCRIEQIKMAQSGSDSHTEKSRQNQ